MLTQQEKQIIEFGKQNGKSADEVKQALNKYRQETGWVAPQPPMEQESQGFMSGVKEDFNKRVNTAADAQVAALEGKQADGSAALQTIGQGAGFIGDLVTRGLSAITPKFIKDPLKAGVQKVGETEPVQATMTKYNEWKQKHPEAAANLEAGVNIASIIPGAKAGVTAAQSLTDAALIGAGKGLVGVSNLLDGAGNVIKGTGGVLYRSAITPNVKEAERILKYRADSPLLTRISDTIEGIDQPPRTRGQTALEYGLQGREQDIGIQAKRLSDSLWNDEIAPAVKASDAVMTKEELFAPAIARINAITDPTRRQSLANALESIIEDYQTFDNSFDLTKAQALKRDLAEFVPSKIYRGQEVASELRTIQADMADAIRQKTYEALKDQNIKQKYLDWANLHELENIGVKAISEAEFKGGSGTLIAGLWDQATVPVKTIGGQTLYRVGDMLEFEGVKGIRTFGEYLQQKGYAKPATYDLPTGEAAMGLSTRDVTRFLHTEDRSVMESYIDSARIGKELTRAQEEMAYKLMERFGISPASSATEIAKKFEQILSGQREFTGTVLPGMSNRP
jgi:hypothetical protein